MGVWLFPFPTCLLVCFSRTSTKCVTRRRSTTSSVRPSVVTTRFSAPWLNPPPQIKMPIIRLLNRHLGHCWVSLCICPLPVSVKCGGGRSEVGQCSCTWSFNQIHFKPQSRLVFSTSSIFHQHYTQLENPNIHPKLWQGDVKPSISWPFLKQKLFTADTGGSSPLARCSFCTSDSAPTHPKRIHHRRHDC